MTQAAPMIEYASPRTAMMSRRLLSLDVFRGLVILAMLVVNNIGDNATTGYFWKHADWPAMSWGQAWTTWGNAIWHPRHYQPDGTDARLRAAVYPEMQQLFDLLLHPWTHVPLFTQCTL